MWIAALLGIITRVMPSVYLYKPALISFYLTFKYHTIKVTWLLEHIQYTICLFCLFCLSVVLCPELNIPNGNVVLTKGSIVGSQASFSCIESHTWTGSSHSSCQSNGTWSGSIGFCSKSLTQHSLGLAVLFPYSNTLSIQQYLSIQYSVHANTELHLMLCYYYK